MAKEQLSSAQLDVDFSSILVDMAALLPVDEAGANNSKLKLLETERAKMMLLGQRVTVSVIEGEDFKEPPITSKFVWFEIEDPEPRHKIQQKRTNEVWGYLTHPDSVTGRIAGLDFVHRAIQVRPRRLSRYSIHNGFFDVELLDSSGKQLVDVKFHD